MERKYDIFISYRREGGEQYARTIQQSLEKQYRVFLDFDELKDGVFDKRIMNAIREAPVFLLILSHGALDRCINENDWVRKEILYAGECARHIVPIVIIDDVFDGIPENLPQDLKKLISAHQFSELQMKTLFKVSMDELIRYRIAPYVVKDEEKSGIVIHIETDMPCSMFQFSTYMKDLQPNVDNVVLMNPGTYKLSFVSTQFPDISITQKYTLPLGAFSDFIEINLKNLVNQKIEEENKRKAEEEERKRREEEARAKERMFKVGNVEFKMIRVEGGTFMMGSRDNDADAFDDEKPQHQVTLSDYYIGETQVTQTLWEAVMGTNVRQQRDKADSSWPLRGEGADYSMYYVSWDECQKFIRELNRLTGKTFRLPTEAEWEFAARGGNKSRGTKYAGSNDISTVAWYDYNSGSKTHLVKGKSPNELGLYDMSGNVWEWCQDWSGRYNSSSQTNPTGSASGSNRVLRGGSWRNIARDCRVVNRINYGPGRRFRNVGFRLSLVHQ